MTIEFKSSNTSPLTKQDIKNAAVILKCEPAAIQAVSSVESGPHGGFINDQNDPYSSCPIILFESHSFHILTHGKYDSSHPGISTSTWVHNYGTSGGHQYERLEEAIKLDRSAALESASWGAYQIMGSNFDPAGYDNVEDFVKGMVDSAAGQLDAFICFLQNQGIDKYFQTKDWTHFALRYNGAGQVQYYAQHIEKAYQDAVAQGWNR